MVRTQVQLGEAQAQAQALKQVASGMGVSAAEAIRQAVDTFLAASRTDVGALRRERALAAIGAYGGSSRLAHDHDMAFAEEDAP
jgi:hypothetical protein